MGRVQARSLGQRRAHAVVACAICFYGAEIHGFGQELPSCSLWFAQEISVHRLEKFFFILAFVEILVNDMSTCSSH